MKPRTLQGRRHLILLVYNHWVHRNHVKYTLFVSLHLPRVSSKCSLFCEYAQGLQSTFCSSLSNLLSQSSCHQSSLNFPWRSILMRSMVVCLNVTSSVSLSWVIFEVICQVLTLGTSNKEDTTEVPSKRCICVLINGLGFVFWRHTADLENGHPIICRPMCTYR